MTDDALPPLPEPQPRPGPDRLCGYSAAQMRAYARAALAQPPQPQAEPVALTDEQIDAGIAAWFSTGLQTLSGTPCTREFRDRMRAAIDAAKGRT